MTVADSNAGGLDDLAGRLVRAGMQVEQVLSAVGAITGSLEDAQLAVVARLAGVAAVEQQAASRIAPPEAEIQ
ncbi:MAG TPA: hypothetical protein VNA28_12595 [Solirubrobacteraceae bacterium]|nr:hypothetical protein [Solirubrobacteraceae bacterium]